MIYRIALLPTGLDSGLSSHPHRTALSAIPRGSVGREQLWCLSGRCSSGLRNRGFQKCLRLAVISRLSYVAMGLVSRGVTQDAVGVAEGCVGFPSPGGAYVDGHSCCQRCLVYGRPAHAKHSANAAGLVGKPHRCRQVRSSRAHSERPGSGGKGEAGHAEERETLAVAGCGIPWESVDEELSRSP